MIVTADSTTFIEGAGTREAVEARLHEIRAELARATQDRDVEVLQERLARLALSLAVIRVGAPTEVVLNERMRRTQGALAATQAAVSEGIVAGGGTALLRSAPALDALAPGRRVRARRRRRALGARASRCTGSPRTPATTARRPSTRSRRCPRATASTRSPASSATSSRRAWSTRSG